MSNYHNRIMNIQRKRYIEDCPDRAVRVSYKNGHKDARHEAAEIAIEAEREIRELKEELECLHADSKQDHDYILMLENELENHKELEGE